MFKVGDRVRAKAFTPGSPEYEHVREIVGYTWEVYFYSPFSDYYTITRGITQRHVSGEIMSSYFEKVGESMTTQKIPCPDCAHTANPGKYLGLNGVVDAGPCQRCNGTTHILGCAGGSVAVTCINRLNAAWAEEWANMRVRASSSYNVPSYNRGPVPWQHGPCAYLQPHKLPASETAAKQELKPFDEKSFDEIPLGEPVTCQLSHADISAYAATDAEARKLVLRRAGKHIPFHDVKWPFNLQNLPLRTSCKEPTLSNTPKRIGDDLLLSLEPTLKKAEALIIRRFWKVLTEDINADNINEVLKGLYSRGALRPRDEEVPEVIGAAEVAESWKWLDSLKVESVVDDSCILSCKPDADTEDEI